MHITRRDLLRTSMLGLSATALAACTISRDGVTMSATLDVAKFKAYASATLSATSTLLSVAAVSSVLGAAGVAAVGVAMGSLQAGLTAFAAEAGTSVTVTLDTSTIRTAAEGVLSDMQALLVRFRATVAVVAPADAVASATTTLSALSTVVALAQAITPTVAPVATAAVQMPEGQALATLGVK
ncbi:MAG: hypothetical protein ACRYG8_03205 [Janthinobacterium lividum]